LRRSNKKKNYESPTADPESTTPTQQYNCASSIKMCPCHHRTHKNCESPTGCLEGPTPAKKTAQARREIRKFKARAQQFFSKRQKPNKTKFPQAHR
jgi:hypothetical protein